MNAILTNINLVSGVSGTFVCDREGAILAREVPQIYDDAMIDQAGHLAAWIGEGLQETGEADLVFDEGRFVVKVLEQGCLCILCVPEVNASLLKMTMNVAVRKLTDELKKGPAPVQETPVQQLETLVRLELGGHSDKALEILAGAGDSPQDLKRACQRIEKMTRLFVDKKTAREMSERMTAILRG